jgi:hypothetical protein
MINKRQSRNNYAMGRINKIKGDDEKEKANIKLIELFLKN